MSAHTRRPLNFLYKQCGLSSLLITLKELTINLKQAFKHTTSDLEKKEIHFEKLDGINGFLAVHGQESIL